MITIPLPKGLVKTILWTQIAEAIEKDFNIELPEKTGPETSKIINDLAKFICDIQHT